ncbi:dicarboxylate/amino acid:cation symporter [Acinetobacter baumannii]|uniref:dicarboxylate/amino acid:cation symporter n=1 Tax=Acinetobacter baumannii TaxID=470 RepID=UPI00046516C1|nr:dicarboxylate/amino acid:cation symporter [Acinetobacter baumannii]AXX46107.1 dicarboxylate/amino acid:cation symporter [Acinetobacter baumannii]EHZ7972683.1 dicarboxylate/amino acid:cation symporter [Acinetobacter baumannii]EIO2225063.1 dicarboxylate/amino acid:cation symporter [Acinetobacter baumannii]EKU0972127.1 dicarboxylate/amino acid:cation symporter [Acinetobacter baumannii]EKU4294237.1 dicarboxylate/amino acid:cation symporter [Acinetobacter baumannii]
MKKETTVRYVFIAIFLGAIIGFICHNLSSTPEQAKEISSYFNLLTDIFLRLIKMIIAPLIFSTIVVGIVSMGRSSSIGKITFKAMAWFISASLISLGLGMLFANVFQPGAGLNLTIDHASNALPTSINTEGFTLSGFITHLFPRSFAEAMANNEILQILIFSIFFGKALSFVNSQYTSLIFKIVEELSNIMFKITEYVMKFAPVAAFSAIASAITIQGISVFANYATFLGSFFLALIILLFILFSFSYLFLKKDTFTLAKLIREPVMLAFVTTSSESAYPKTMDALNKFGVPKQVTSFVLPLGYSFNLDGSMMYAAFAILFIAQAYNIDLSIMQQVLILLTLMITSKGIAGVSKASIVVVAATLSLFKLPEAGLLLILAIDQFLDMGRTATNVVGNSIATAVIARTTQLGELPEEINTNTEIIISTEQPTS